MVKTGGGRSSFAPLVTERFEAGTMKPVEFSADPR